MPVTSITIHAAVRSVAHGNIVVPHTRLRLYNCAFCVAGPALWNSVTSGIQTASTHSSTFKNRLKTLLFLQSHFVAQLTST